MYANIGCRLWKTFSLFLIKMQTHLVTELLSTLTFALHLSPLCSWMFHYMFAVCSSAASVVHVFVYLSVGLKAAALFPSPGAKHPLTLQ